MMQKVEPVFLIEPFRLINLKLLEFLRSLSIEDWNRQTISPKWVVKDVVAHLLDGNLRRISVIRDQYISPTTGIDDYRDLVDFLNQLNADWVQAFKRVSPQLLMELLETTGNQVYEIFKSLPPFGKAVFGVSWAGEEQSDNWFDIGREYSEKWIHQQQIRHTFGDSGILNREFFFPCLDILMRGLPYTYREIRAPEGTVIRFTITGEGGGDWFLVRRGENWDLMTGENQEGGTHTILDNDTAWKLFSKAIKDPREAESKLEIKGNRKLGGKILEMVSVMA